MRWGWDWAPKRVPFPHTRSSMWTQHLQTLLRGWALLGFPLQESLPPLHPKQYSLLFTDSFTCQRFRENPVGAWPCAG